MEDKSTGTAALSDVLERTDGVHGSNATRSTGAARGSDVLRVVDDACVVGMLNGANSVCEIGTPENLDGACSKERPDGTGERRIGVFCVGNKLMLDDGLGAAVYEELVERYEMPANVELFDVGCLSMDMLPYVRDFDVLITVDAVDGTDAEPGTVFRFEPSAMARHSGATASLHDLKLVDLFDAAALLGYEAEGLCLGMQIENPSPAVVTIGLTPKVAKALPLLVETVAGELARLGAPLISLG